MTPITRALPDGLQLLSGSHSDAEFGRAMCVMEAVAFVAGEPHSDTPACACPVVSAFMRSWNDAIRDDAHRTALLSPFVPRLVDSKSTKKVEQRRADLALDWLVRVQTPAWMDLSPSLTAHAATLRALVPLTTLARVKASSAAIAAARDAGAAAMAAAWAAAGAAAMAAAWDAAGAAARAAAMAAAGAAAGPAAVDAAVAAAWDAARAAARAALQPTVTWLEQSALILVDRMLQITPDTTDADMDAMCQWEVTR